MKNGCETCLTQGMIDRGPKDDPDKLQKCANYLEHFLEIAVRCANCADNSTLKEHNWQPREVE